ncbi:MAG: DUF305 domain-containing protein [Solirubrobacteraceae bacterium]|nr:DUF305 domain-containing protein [Patulibacter sp.]
MSTRSPRHLARLAGPVAVAVLLAGCGSKTDDAAKATSPAPASAAATQPGAPAETGHANPVDAAFVREMIPHHELAIEMASYVRKRSSHAEVKALAQRISTTQRDEVTELKAAAKRLHVTLPAGDGMPSAAQMRVDSATLGIPSVGMGMSMDPAMLKSARPFDKAFLTDMIPHHQGAITMARAEVVRGGDQELKTLAGGIAATQNAEIIQMAKWRLAWYPAKS